MPPRKMNVLIPAIASDGSTSEWKPLRDCDHLIPQFLSGYRNDMFCLINRQPAWSPVHNSYYLKFDKRNALPSVKNFQLIDPLNRNSSV